MNFRFPTSITDSTATIITAYAPLGNIFVRKTSFKTCNEEDFNLLITNLPMLLILQNRFDNHPCSEIDLWVNCRTWSCQTEVDPLFLEQLHLMPKDSYRLLRYQLKTVYGRHYSLSRLFLRVWRPDLVWSRTCLSH